MATKPTGNEPLGATDLQLTNNDKILILAALGKYRDLSERAVSSAKNNGETELAELHERKIGRIDAVKATIQGL